MRDLDKKFLTISLRRAQLIVSGITDDVFQQLDEACISYGPDLEQAEFQLGSALRAFIEVVHAAAGMGPTLRNESRIPPGGGTSTDPAPPQLNRPESGS